MCMADPSAVCQSQMPSFASYSTTTSGGTECPRPRPGHDGNHGGVARRFAKRRGAEDVGSEDRDCAHAHGRIRFAVCDPHVPCSVLGLVGRCAPHDLSTTSRGGERHRHTIGRGACRMLGRARVQPMTWIGCGFVGRPSWEALKAGARHLHLR